MTRTNLPISLSNLKKWYEAESPTLRCTLPFQRHADMWNSITKSNLVWSLLADSYIPPIVLLKDKTGENDKGKDIYSYQIEDGLQRLTTLFSFMNDGFQLHGATPEVEVDGTVYDLAGLKFSELSAECQDAIKNYRFSVQCLENYTSEEAENLFYNINSGVALSSIQKSKSKLGTDLITLFNKLLRGTFFTQAINISERQAKAEDDLLMLIQTAMLLDNRSDGREYKNISAATALEYAAEIRGTYTREKREMLTELVGYLDKAFTEKNKFLRRNNMPIVGVCAEIAKEQGVEPLSFKAFINDFSNGVYPVYDEASGSGNIKAPKVQMRLRVMFLAMCQYYGWDEQTVGLPFAKSIPLHIESEQSAEDGDQSSSGGAGEPISTGVLSAESESSTENSKVTADMSSPDNASADSAEKSAEQEQVAV